MCKITLLEGTGAESQYRWQGKNHSKLRNEFSPLASAPHSSPLTNSFLIVGLWSQSLVGGGQRARGCRDISVNCS